MCLLSLVFGYRFIDFYSGSSPVQAIHMKQVCSGKQSQKQYSVAQAFHIHWTHSLGFLFWITLRPLNSTLAMVFVFELMDPAAKRACTSVAHLPVAAVKPSGFKSVIPSVGLSPNLATCMQNTNRSWQYQQQHDDIRGDLCGPWRSPHFEHQRQVIACPGAVLSPDRSGLTLLVHNLSELGPSGNDCCKQAVKALDPMTSINPDEKYY